MARPKQLTPSGQHSTCMFREGNYCKIMDECICQLRECSFYIEGDEEDYKKMSEKADEDIKRYKDKGNFNA